MKDIITITELTEKVLIAKSADDVLNMLNEFSKQEFNRGYDAGFDDGRAEGYLDGYDDGYGQGLCNAY